MNGQEKATRIHLLRSNLFLAGVSRYSDAPFINNLRLKCPVNPSPESSLDLPTWSYAEYVKVIEELPNQISNELIPFLKDEVLIALAHEGVGNACKKLMVTETVFLEEQKKDALWKIGMEEDPMTNIERISLMATAVGHEIDTIFKHNATVIDILFMHAPYLYEAFHEIFSKNPGICLSSVPETDFDANYKALLAHLKHYI